MYLYWCHFNRLLYKQNFQSYLLFFFIQKFVPSWQGMSHPGEVRLEIVHSGQRYFRTIQNYLQACSDTLDCIQ